MVAAAGMLMLLGSRHVAPSAPPQQGSLQPSVGQSLLADKDLNPHDTYVRWLWCPLLVYLFWGMAYVCDGYFVRTIEVISERFNIPDDVAGATLMAMGCNGPEMALNTISIFHPSDIVVGAVIGGEVFNVLVIIGAAMLATPEAYLPLKISNFSFFRDVAFYMISVMMLYFVLMDGQVTRTESLTLIAGAVVYSTTVAMTSTIRETFYSIKRSLADRWRSVPEAACEGVRATNRTTNRASLRRSASIAEVLNGPCRTKSCMRDSEPDDLASDLANDSDFENEPEQELVDAWAGARQCTDPLVGSVFSVRVEVRSRMMDRSSKVEERYMWLTDKALMVSAAVAPEVPMKCRGRGNGMVFDSFGWHYGGLVNAPDICDGERVTGPRPVESKNTEVLLRASKVPQEASILGLHEVPCEEILLQSILYCDPVPGNPTMFTLHVHQEDRVCLGRLITLEFLSEAPAVQDTWIQALRESLQRRSLGLTHSAHQPPRRQSMAQAVQELAGWFQFPVKFLAKVTIPDMDRPDMQHWYPVAFVMSMSWLAMFAYLVVTACSGIHDDFGVPTGILGFTIAAAGTSFPNVFSGMVVSRQGKTTMAVANALGANVQNVFLALAVPWSIQSCLINHGPFPMPVTGLETQIAAIYITLIPVVLIFLCCSCTLPRWSGYVFLLTYIAYLIIALGEQSTGCMSWPLNCN